MTTKLRRTFSRALAALFFGVAWLLQCLGFKASAKRAQLRGSGALLDTVEIDPFGGVFLIEVIRDGKHGPVVLQRQVVPNLVVNTGKRQTWRMASGLNTNDWDQGRIGTCGAAANSGQTNVISPVTGTLNTVDQKTLLAGTRTFQLVVSYPSGAGSKSATGIKEVVILNQNTSPGGSALARAVFSAVNKTTADKLKIQYRVRIS
jgi:hypothetical protein